MREKRPEGTSGGETQPAKQGSERNKVKVKGTWNSVVGECMGGKVVVRHPVESR